jgi:hypothetical protein
MYHHEHQTGRESPTAIHGFFLNDEAEDFFVDVGAPWLDDDDNEEGSKKKRGRDTDEGAMMMLDFAAGGGDEFDSNPTSKSPKRVPKSSPNKPVSSPMSPMSAMSSMSICDDTSDTFTERCARLDSGCLPLTSARAVRGPAPTLVQALQPLPVTVEEGVMGSMMLTPKEPLHPSSVESAKRRELQDVTARADDGLQSAWVAPNECARAVVDIDGTAQRLTLTHFNSSFLRVFCDGSPVREMTSCALDLSQFFGEGTDTNETTLLRQAMQAGGRHLSILRLYTLVHRHVRRVHVALTMFASPEPLPGLARRSIGVLTFRDICTVAHSVRHGFPLIAPRIAPSFKQVLLEKYCNSVGLRRNFRPLKPKAVVAPERPPTPIPAASLIAAGPLGFASERGRYVHMQHTHTDPSYVPAVVEKDHVHSHSHFGTGVRVTNTSCSATSYAMTITDDEIADAVLV